MHQTITDFSLWQELLKAADGIGWADHEQGALNGFFHPIQLYCEGIGLIGCQIFQGRDGIGQLAQLGFVFNSGIIDSLGNGPDGHNIHEIIIIDFPNIHGLGLGQVQGFNGLGRVQRDIEGSGHIIDRAQWEEAKFRAKVLFR